MQVSIAQYGKIREFQDQISDFSTLVPTTRTYIQRPKATKDIIMATTS